MGIKKNIVNILITACWFILGAGVLVLLIAAVNIKSQKACKEIVVDISGVKDLYFLDRDDVLRIVTEGSMQPAPGKSFTSFNLQRLERRLEENVYVKDAELFFDNNLVLHVTIEEREPIARVFTTHSQSFYIDRAGTRLPLRDKMIVRLPVFTGFQEGLMVGDKQDSLLLDGIARLSEYILQDPFWMAQIAQVDILAGKGFELIPTLGNHVIHFGDASKYQDKFARLTLFYKQVLSKAGLDKYSRINIEYDEQVIGTRREGMPRIDSIQALKNVRRLFDAAMWKPEDSTGVKMEQAVLAEQAETLRAIKSVDSVAPATNTDDEPKALPPAPKKTVKKVPTRAATESRPEAAKPKAVMQKFN